MPTNPGHYIIATHGVTDTIINTLIDNPTIRGISIVYNWVDLEISKGVYDFSRIESDLALLRPLNKHLIVMIRDKSFKNNPFIPVPEYLRTAEYQGGYATGDHEMIAKRWVHSVGIRFRALITALGNQFDLDPNFEAIKTSESATGNIKYFSDYDATQYVNELNFTSYALAKAFPNTVKVMYLNWIPGSGSIESKLSEVAAYAKVNGVGIGGPDVHPDVKIPSYDLYPTLANDVPLMTDIQWSNFEHVFPQGDTDQLFNFALSELHVSYICWKLRSPYTQNILNTINKYPVL
ncbi:MAG: hypothetical protein JKY53_12775 [Flavobacteriales bacterium]|nr:hypothetical protein [Flavobacteriales bacterium]